MKEELDDKSRNVAEEFSFYLDAKAAVERRQPKGGRILIWMTLVAIVTFILWAAWIEIDEITRGMGKVIPSRQIQDVQNLEGGIVGDILVKEGETVDKGQILMTMDDTQFMSSLGGQKISRTALEIKRSRLRAEVVGEFPLISDQAWQDAPDLAQQELELYGSRQQELESRKNVLLEQVDQNQQQIEEMGEQRKLLGRRRNLLKEELGIASRLAESGAVSRIEVLRLQRQVSDVDGELAVTKETVDRLNAQQKEVHQRINELQLTFVSSVRSELNETQAKIKELEATGTALEDRVARTQVRSPVKGVVKQILVNTKGGVVQPGMKMMEVVPLDDKLLIETRIRPQDIGFLHPGQKAVVRFTAYDFTIYGGIEGKLTHISADTITDEQGESFYLAHVETERNNLDENDATRPVITGMIANVDIMTGKKPLLSYLLKPVLRARQLAFSER
ncbi:HlyD family type I secretion periplasmic adaptor subunit [Sansalvadorimonas sp. 2012CJ34-2]|uniref:Membrane fusion protein (MFP) family protein n=1 Tax=Parendozoicomonas callyspongiae TaxID=2942213 RepID=A0ABT0PHU6_9GAMM|nr:HlyD family type I secretion periplasmic adaptor subunit [Sansalvadorimonas sp. 2012CJ34-2]MCL6270908.1 HlyD family type I secretion periplasmic adaptor subunit [Sansalvadorimonas sp. 2012CJ34-2]